MRKDPAVKVKILFLEDGGPDDKDEVLNDILKLYLLNPDGVLSIIREWFIKKDSTTWKKKFDLTLQPEPIVGKMLAKQREWCHVSEIIATPSVFLNGYVLPEPYALEDLVYLLS